MSIGQIIDIGRQAVYVVLVIIIPILGSGLITGLLVAILQATTQIQEQTLAFVPKILVVFISIGIFAPWMLTTFTDFVEELFDLIPQVIG